MTDLFTSDSQNETYMHFKTECKDWHKFAKDYWNKLYHTHQEYLDENFPSQFKINFVNRLWELTLINYLASQKDRGIQLINISQNRKISKPDFCFTHNGVKFYIEAVCASTSKPEHYLGLNQSLEEIDGKARRKPIGEYRERLTASLREKISCKYDPQTCGCEKPHNFKGGYREYLGNSGLIIAVSMAQIPFYNQPALPHVEISCLFPCSPFPTIDIPLPGAKLEKAREPYHQYQVGFNKATNGSEIKTDYFSNPRYSYISAVLVSNSGHVFFSDTDKYELGVCWPESRNDFFLIHNPLASKKLPYKLFPVAREATAEINDHQFNIFFK